MLLSNTFGSGPTQQSSNSSCYPWHLLHVLELLVPGAEVESLLRDCVLHLLYLTSHRPIIMHGTVPTEEFSN